MTTMTTATATRSIGDYLGSEADDLLGYQAKVDASHLHHPGPDYVDRVWAVSDRPPQVLPGACVDHPRASPEFPLGCLHKNKNQRHKSGPGEHQGRENFRVQRR